MILGQLCALRELSKVYLEHALAAQAHLPSSLPEDAADFQAFTRLSRCKLQASSLEDKQKRVQIFLMSLRCGAPQEMLDTSGCLTRSGSIKRAVGDVSRPLQLADGIAMGIAAKSSCR